MTNRMEGQRGEGGDSEKGPHWEVCWKGWERKRRGQGIPTCFLGLPNKFPQISGLKTMQAYPVTVVGVGRADSF